MTTFLLYFAAALVVAQAESQNSLILILLDGFRWDYFQIYGLKGFPRLMREGVKAEYMEALYPSESYPGYYSIVTGRFAESHGMVLNYMYDEKHNSFFEMEPKEDSKLPFWWEDAEPLWITTTRNNISTGLYHFPGGDVEIFGLKPKQVRPYQYLNGVEYFIFDLQEALDAIYNNEIRYAQVYCEYPDRVGHAHGPFSHPLNQSIIEIDHIINKLLDQIIEKQLHKTLHLVIVSDHGMTKTDSVSVQKIYLNRTVNPADIKFVLDRGSHFGIYPEENRLEKVFNDLKKLEGVDVYKKNEIPERYHFKNHDRVPPLYGIVRKGYFLIGLPDDEKQIPSDSEDKIWNGFHGYDPKEPDMNAIFLAWGSSFKENYVASPIHITDPYNLMAHILNVTALPNNGTWNNMEAMLQSNFSGMNRDLIDQPSLKSSGLKIVQFNIFSLKFYEKSILLLLLKMLYLTLLIHH